MTIQIIAGSITFCLWYLYSCADCMLNGGYFRPGIPLFIPFLVLWEDFLFALPIIGRKMKGDYIRERVDYKRKDGSYSNGAMCSMSSDESWDYEEIRRDNLYEKVGCAMLPGFWSFVCVNVIGPFFVYIGLYKLMEFLVYLFGRMF